MFTIVFILKVHYTLNFNFKSNLQVKVTIFGKKTTGGMVRKDFTFYLPYKKERISASFRVRNDSRFYLRTPREYTHEIFACERYLKMHSYGGTKGLSIFLLCIWKEIPLRKKYIYKKAKKF